MVTKIKPYRIRDVNEPEEWNSLQYNDPNTFARWEGGGWGWGWADIEYVTEQEYDNLPSSKFSDGKHYIQYKSTGLLTLEELSNMCIESREK